jgi:Uma2 family endonuclease
MVAYMTSAKKYKAFVPEALADGPGHSEQRVLLPGIPWKLYVALRDAVDDFGGRVSMTYLAGKLELMSPSSRHEIVKTIIARLLEAWAVERDVPLNGLGNTTFKDRARELGLEPDVCYTRKKYKEGDPPEVAVEVSLSRGLVNKLDIYAALKVREVWEWQDKKRALVVGVRVGKRYVVREGSSVFPELDLAGLVRFVREEADNHTSLVREYLAALRTRR